MNGNQTWFSDNVLISRKKIKWLEFCATSRKIMTRILRKSGLISLEYLAVFVVFEVLLPTQRSTCGQTHRGRQLAWILPTRHQQLPRSPRTRHFPRDMLLLPTYAQERAWRLLKISSPLIGWFGGDSPIPGVPQGQRRFPGVHCTS